MLGFVRIAPPADAPQAALFIRDQTSVVTRFGRTPGIAGRFKSIDWQKTVLLVAMVFKVRMSDAAILYDLLLNLREPAGALSAFVELATQPRLIVQFFGDDAMPLTACMIHNPFQEFARRIMAQLDQYPAWSEEQFQEAAADLRRRHPTTESLWDALDHTAPPAQQEP